MSEEYDKIEEPLAPDSDTKNNPKVKRPVKRKAIGESIQRSRISYADRRKMNVTNQDPNFVYRWVNTDDNYHAGRVDKFEAMGYTRVIDRMSSGDEHGVGASTIGGSNTKHVGQGVKGVLMRQKREYYEADQAEKMLEVDKTEMGLVEDKKLQGSDMYGEGIKIESVRE